MAKSGLVVIKEIMPDVILLIFDDGIHIDIGLLLKIWDSTSGLVFFSSAISFLISNLFEEVVPSSWQVVHVSVKWQAVRVRF